MFSAQQALADKRLEPFDFIDLAGEQHQLPHFKSLTSDQSDRFLAGDDPFGLLAEIATPEAARAIKAFPLAILEEFVQDWHAHSEATPGESAASSRSSASTAGPSKPISRASTASKTRRR